MMSGDAVSVIMPAWRSAATIGRALASVAAQTVPPLEVVVVDDGSDDGTAEAALAWRERLAPVRLTVLSQPNRGAGAARNRAIAAAAGTLLAFLDADDEWLPEKLAASLAALGDNLFVSHDMVVGEAVFDCARHFRGAADPFAALFKRGFVATSTVLARKDAVLAAGGFREDLRAAQDYDLWLRLAAGGRFAVFAGALTRYHVNPAGITSNVERRRQCSQAVLAGNAASLRGRKGALATVLLRALVIQYEAVAAWRGRKPWRAAAEALRTPFALAWAAGRLHPALDWPWWWLAAAGLAYGWQYREMASAILARVGLAP